MNKKKRVIRLLTIIYVIFFVNVGIGLLLTKYRVMVVVPMFILIMLQCQPLLGNFIKKVKFPIYTVAFDVNYNYRFKFYF